MAALLQVCQLYDQDISLMLGLPPAIERKRVPLDADTVAQSALLRCLQRTLAVIGRKLSSRDKLPQLLRGTGGKSLATLAKERFGDLLVEHPSFADLFSDERFQADIESIMDDISNGGDGWSAVALQHSAKVIAERVNSLRQLKMTRLAGQGDSTAALK